MEALNKELIGASHQAGMAEVATGVLHNVGNVLNSVNISSTLVIDGIRKSKVANLTKAVELIGEHEADLGDFITSDPKGKLLPGYLVQLADHLIDEQDNALKELKPLKKNIEHIREIVNTQQLFACSAGLIEPLDVRAVLED